MRGYLRPLALLCFASFAVLDGLAQSTVDKIRDQEAKATGNEAQTALESVLAIHKTKVISGAVFLPATHAYVLLTTLEFEDGKLLHHGPWWGSKLGNVLAASMAWDDKSTPPKVAVTCVGTSLVDGAFWQKLDGAAAGDVSRYTTVTIDGYVILAFATSKLGQTNASGRPLPADSKTEAEPDFNAALKDKKYVGALAARIFDEKDLPDLTKILAAPSTDVSQRLFVFPAFGGKYSLQLELPAQYAVLWTNGPDFDVTYFEDDPDGRILGFYRGWHPNRQSDHPVNLKLERKSGSFGKSTVEWLEWEAEDKFHAETTIEDFFGRQISPDAHAFPAPVLHIFLETRTKQDREMLENLAANVLSVTPSNSVQAFQP